jgi:hypothetical protein
MENDTLQFGLNWNQEVNGKKCLVIVMVEKGESFEGTSAKGKPWMLTEWYEGHHYKGNPVPVTCPETGKTLQLIANCFSWGDQD